MKVAIDRNIALICFVHNLANWHLSCVPSFYYAWAKEHQPLSEIEKGALVFLTKLFRDYLSKNEELWIKELFITNQKATIPPHDLPYFNIFLSRFNYFFKLQKPNMVLVSKYLENLEDKFLKKILSTRSFYRFNEGTNVSTYLTLSANANKQASGMLLEVEEQNRYFVVMEYGDYILTEDNWTIDNVYLHELTHVFQCSQHFKDLIEEASVKMKGREYLADMMLSQKDMLTEIIHASLWGECGFFSRKIFGNKLDAGLDRKGDRYKSKIERVAAMIQPVVASYLASQ